MAYWELMFSPDEPPPESDAEELLKRASDLVEALERLGLYVKDHQVALHDQPEPRTWLFVTAVLGRLAFSDGVQRPEQEAFDELFDEMTDKMVEDEFEERRRALDD